MLNFSIAGCPSVGPFSNSYIFGRTCELIVSRNQLIVYSSAVHMA
jgi:hypothetical protein